MLYIYWFASLAAGISADPYDYLNGSNNHASIGAGGVTTDPVLLNIASSFVHMLEVIGALGTVISLILCGCKLLWHKNDPRMLPEVKREIAYRCLIAVAIFSFLGIAGVVLDVCFLFARG